jgi:hypothetical protein
MSCIFLKKAVELVALAGDLLNAVNNLKKNLTSHIPNYLLKDGCVMYCFKV